jgi:SAM-dependent methyltransferase
MSDDFYDDLAPIYDRMIPWERRLAREGPWLEALFRRVGARSVLDAACGSGGHLPFLAGLGLSVSAADASEAMLALARERVERLPDAARPSLTQATWAELPQKIAATFDVVLCLGNSLPYVTDDEGLRASLAGLWSRVAPGGLLLIQFKNFARRRHDEDRLLPISGHFDAEQGDAVVARVYDWEGDLVRFNVLIMERAAPGASWRLRQQATPLRAWSADRLTGELCALGARVREFGSLGLDPFDPTQSEDVVLWASRPKL